MVTIHDLFAVSVEFSAFQEQWQSSEIGLDTVLFGNGHMSSCTNLDVISCFCNDDISDAGVDPVISSLVEQVFEVKIKGKHPIKDVHKIAVHWMVGEGDVAVASASEGVVVVRCCGDSVHGFETAETQW